ncbi:CTP synthase [Bifidobacterium sp. B4001]|uniref:CTP synthase n=1 Tax=Bifidobacterium TaxID=1678 RepID=UPI001C6A5A61|nr:MULTISPECIES: CTP synthase [Bifidobacterium]MCX8643613.1 CTP synthase [Bifidobacterium sp. B4077]MCX8645795.1 CTP synthase [Bifidobacterium sp. B4081]MCX8647454.1 CTP synthase [Bifidobacterium sp. B4107]MCX8651634.1 CTP synthase [Bifidobacterium sp. B4111]MCX8658065.1 CTP synthase [Bifidobacterium sp. B4114]
MVREHGNPQGHITKHIFVTGGVVSSLGKGLTASSLGRLLRSRGIRVLQQKLDPYINVDPGTMNPFQHGEVYVTEDGAETDLDIGHYERFTDVFLSQKANVTTGQIYQSVLRKERAGEYLGQCVQVIPHVTNEIKSRMRAQASDDVDVIITEIGGTVGDIESQPFMEAAREVRRDIGPDNCMFVHVSLVPYVAAAHELKTKPTQHSVMALRQLGIAPDALVLRSDRPLNQGIKDKISLMCDVDAEGVVNCVDAPSIYDVPKILYKEGLDTYVVRKLGLPFHDVDWNEWEDLLDRVHNPRTKVTVAIVGKYIDLPDAYLSVIEALKAGGFANRSQVQVKLVAADTCETMDGARKALEGVDGIVVPGGFGIRGIEGKIGALRYARETGLPALGLCLGLQSMVIEFARHVLELEDANSSEFEPDCENPVIATMEEQKEIVAGHGDMGHTMRLGAYPAVLKPDSLVARLYGSTEISERHRHRYEVNVAYKERLDKAGLHISGTSPDGQLTEFVELSQDQHPFYVGTQAHPEFKSRPTKPHPLFTGLVKASLEHGGQEAA